MTPDEALAILHALANPDRAADALAYHKVDRPYLGIPVPQIDTLARDWRALVTLEQRLTLAAGLWDSNIHEGRVAAAKLLIQARIRPDDGPAWALIASWVPQFDAWAIADHVSIAGGKRLIANPGRLDDVAGWTTSPHMWSRRAALVMTLPWTRQNHPKPLDLAIRDRILGWAATYVSDPEWFIQKSVAWWLRELSRHDAPRALAFLEQHGAAMKPFARREAARHMVMPGPHSGPESGPDSGPDHGPEHPLSDT